MSEVSAETTTLIHLNTEEAVLELWHGDRKITAYVDANHTHVLLVASDGSIMERDHLYAALRWLMIYDEEKAKQAQEEGTEGKEKES